MTTARVPVGAARVGLANVITGSRLLIAVVAFVLLLVATGGDSRPLLIVAAVLAGVSLLLDGIDGRVARYRGEASRFGAAFDNEADAATVALLSVGVWINGIAGWWVLLIGAMRYLFLFAGLAVPALRGRLPVSMLRKVIGISQGISLAVAVFGFALHPSVWWELLPAIALVALFWSFGRDAVQLLARR
jgi:phosphatidylglycerophosphate synthase